MSNEATALPSVATTSFDRRKGTKVFRLIGATPRSRIKDAEFATEHRLRVAHIPIPAMVSSGALAPVDQDEADAMLTRLDEAIRERVAREEAEAKRLREEAEAKAEKPDAEPAEMVDEATEPIDDGEPDAEPIFVPRKPRSQKAQRRTRRGKRDDK